MLCKYEYDVPLDDLNKAREIRVCSVKRPHMRGFWFGTVGFFVAFVGWFAFAPLMPTVKAQLGLTKGEIGLANTCAVMATILARVVVGPLCDKLGPRRCMSFVLLTTCIPVALGAIVTGPTGLIVDRLFVGLAGASFVPCQFWTMAMFSANVVGTANAMSGGWGNLGGGFVQAFMPLVFLIVKACGATDDAAWRISLQVPAVFFLVLGTTMLFFSDDCPEGQWANRIESASAERLNWTSVFTTAIFNRNTWTLVVLYGCCFGIELFVNNAAVLFLYNGFTKGADCDPARDPGQCRVLTQATAGLIASLFGLMNLFARAVGGYLSDLYAKKAGMAGRMRVLMVTIFGTGAMMVIFSQMRLLPAAIVMLVIFSAFVQSAEGATFGVVPFVDPRNKGVVSGLVGAGGNAGAVIWSTTYNAIGSAGKADVEQDRLGLLMIGCIVAGCSLLCLLLNINGRAIFWGAEGTGSQVFPEKEQQQEPQSGLPRPPSGFHKELQVQEEA